MRRIFLPVIPLIIISNIVNAQKQKSAGDNPTLVTAPGLVVGIVVDQMRYDYLYKFWKKYSNDGFKRLVNEGFLFSNTNYNYVPTYTAPGHACIFTGTTPSYNGIISNEWYDRYSNQSVYCVGDSTVNAVGTTSISGKMSPRNLVTTTVTDELRLASNMQSKVIGIALKDRGAILPTGRTGNAAYWHDPYLNNWVTSTYYMENLPKWVENFNNRKVVDSLLSNKWTTLLPIEQYTESTADNNEYEGLFKGESKPVFPHDLPALKANESELIRETPFGNTYTKEFALAAIKNENLGKGKATDFLTVSFSSTDYVGHMYGINSIELEDTYLRLDRDIAEMLKFLDAWTGNNYLLFLSSDHGAVNNPGYSDDHNIHSGFFETRLMGDSLKQYIKTLYGDTLVTSVSAHNIYLNRSMIEAKKISLEEVQNRCVEFVTKFRGVATAMTATELQRGNCRTGIYSFIQNGYHPQRSADVLIQLQSGWINWFTKTGTTHSAAYSYDTHVPLIFFGRDIKSGSSDERVTVCDIAPTISMLLNIELPSGNTGSPLTSFLD